MGINPKNPKLPALGIDVINYFVYVTRNKLVCFALLACLLARLCKWKVQQKSETKKRKQRSPKIDGDDDVTVKAKAN